MPRSPTILLTLCAMGLLSAAPVAPDAAPRFAELGASVRVVTDRWGVPHVSAATLDDLYWAWGYITARDRLWELEITRRNARGRQWEWFGNAPLTADGGAELFDFAGHAARAWRLQQRDPATARALERYAAGINQYVAQCRSGALPWREEFRVLGHFPEPWKPEDSLLEMIGFGVLLDLDLPELDEARVIREHGLAWFKRRHRFEGDGTVNTIPDSAARRLYSAGAPLESGAGAERNAGVTPHLLAEAHARLLALRPDGGDSEAGRASNAFAVGAGRSASGRPLLANDPHLTLGAPGPLHLIHVTVPGVMDAIGVAPLGVPAIVSGRNARCAWGVTALSADMVDVYADTLSADGRQVRWRGGWAPVRTAPYHLRFQVLGVPLPPLGQVRRYTPHGPVVAFDRRRRLALSVRWAGLERPVTLSRLIGIERSGTALEACERFRSLVAPGLNIVAADRDGGVRYQTVGLIPHRGFDPLPGPFPDDGRHEWSGFVAAARMPAWSPPRDGFVVNANNRPVGAPYPEPLPRYDWFHDRARRISMRLAGDREITLADLASVQNDVHSLAADRLLPQLLRCADSLAATPREHEALDTLRRWDRMARRDRVGPTLFRAWVGALNRRSHFEGTPGLMAAALDGRAPEAFRTPDDHGERPAVAALKALDVALDSLAARFGPRLAGWRYGAAHEAIFTHRLEARGRAWQPAPLPADGDNSTPCVGPSALPWRITFTHGSVFRHLVDLAVPESSLAVLPPGNRGARDDPHARDQLRRWANHGYFPLYLSWPMVERAKESELTLAPAGAGAARR